MPPEVAIGEKCQFFYQKATSNLEARQFTLLLQVRTARSGLLAQNLGSGLKAWSMHDLAATILL